MKKGWKIALISVGSLLGVVVMVVAVAMWLVFTPSQLTKIVNKVAGDYVLAASMVVFLMTCNINLNQYSYIPK